MQGLHSGPAQEAKEEQVISQAQEGHVVTPNSETHLQHPHPSNASLQYRWCPTHMPQQWSEDSGFAKCFGDQILPSSKVTLVHLQLTLGPDTAADSPIEFTLSLLAINAGSGPAGSC